MHLGWPVPTVPIPTSPLPTILQPFLPYHISHALDPNVAATLINIKSCAVTRSLTLNLLIWLLDHQKQFKVFLNSQKYQIVLLVVLSICEVTQGNVQILIYIFNCWTAQHFCVALYLIWLLDCFSPKWIQTTFGFQLQLGILFVFWSSWKESAPHYIPILADGCENQMIDTGDVTNPARYSAALNARVFCRI